MTKEASERVMLNLPVNGVWQGLDFLTGERRFLVSVPQPNGQEGILEVTEEIHDGLVQAFLDTPQARAAMGEGGEDRSGPEEDTEDGRTPSGDDDGFDSLEGGSEF